MIYCTECGTKLNDNCVCPNCGFNCEVRRGTILLLECKNCKEPIACDDKYCNRCGQKLKTNTCKNSLRNNGSDENNILKNGMIVYSKYELKKLIGRTGLSTVYLAKDIHTEKNVVIKVFEIDNLPNGVSSKNFDNDYLLLNITHPFIHKVYDIFNDDKYVLIVSEYLEGQWLDDYINKYGAQTEQQVVEWTKQICDILVYLSNLIPPIILRDIKPQNFIIKADKLVLADLTLAIEYSEIEKENTTSLGTVGYAAPEQYGNNQKIDCRTDIYGLGAMMHYFLTGVEPSISPFDKKPVREYNPQLSAGIEYIVLKCTMVDPDLRYQTPIELQNDLNKIEKLPPKSSLFKRFFKKKNDN